jgi:hypothetical protein
MAAGDGLTARNIVLDGTGATASQAEGRGAAADGGLAGFASGVAHSAIAAVCSGAASMAASGHGRRVHVRYSPLLATIPCPLDAAVEKREEGEQHCRSSTFVVASQLLPHARAPWL